VLPLPVRPSVVTPVMGFCQSDCPHMVSREILRKHFRTEFLHRHDFSGLLWVFHRCALLRTRASRYRAERLGHLNPTSIKNDTKFRLRIFFVEPRIESWSIQWLIAVRNSKIFAIPAVIRKISDSTKCSARQTRPFYRDHITQWVDIWNM
jgi:hypothetical protein